MSCLALALAAGLVLGAGLAAAQASVPTVQDRPRPLSIPPSDHVIESNESNSVPGPLLVQVLITEICGSIVQDSVLTLATSPYTVTCDTTIEPSVTLEIEPGVEIGFEPGTDLTIRGTLLASGTQTQPITFTSALASPAPGDWEGLHIEAGSPESHLAWCVVEYATTGVHVYAGPGTSVSPTLSACTVRHHLSHGIVVEGHASGCDAASAQPVIIGGTVEQNGACGIYAHGHGDPNHGCVPARIGRVAGAVRESTLRGNQRAGICLRAERGYQSHGDVELEIQANRISDNAGPGIGMESDDPVHPRIENNTIYENADSGIYWNAKHGGLSLFVVNNTLTGNGDHGLLVNSAAEQMRVTNNIVSGNDHFGLSCATALLPVTSHNDVWSNMAGNYSGCIAGTGDISADPLLVDAAAGDSRLQPGSPCIDAGTGSDAPATDIEGVPRPQGAGFDIGAHEFWASQIRVTQAGVEIQPGDRYDFGRVSVGADRAAAFAIGNLGSKPLLLEAIEVVPEAPYTLALSGTLPLSVAPGMSTTFQVRFMPDAPGERAASVSITSDDPKEGVYTFFVEGQGVRPLADLTLNGPDTGLIQTSHAFVAEAAPADVTLPLTYTWLATGQPSLVHVGGLSDAVSFAWGTAGAQQITVTAENAGNAITRSHSLTLYSPVRAGFYGAPTSGLVPLAVTFTNTSTGDYTDSRWDFGDGQASILAGPTHTYSTVGVYTVVLEIQGPGGTDTSTREAYISVESYRHYLPLVLHRMDIPNRR